MKPNNIDPQKTSVAATFFEPVYQRLRTWSPGRIKHLLGFTQSVGAATREILQAAGAQRSSTDNAECFAEVWQLSDQPDQCSAESLQELDQRIADSLRCQSGRFSANCGHLRWDDSSDQPHRRRHVLSQLLEESRNPRRVER